MVSTEQRLTESENVSKEDEEEEEHCKAHLEISNLESQTIFLLLQYSDVDVNTGVPYQHSFFTIILVSNIINYLDCLSAGDFPGDKSHEDEHPHHQLARVRDHKVWHL